jgi:hypothetical protein
MKTITHHGIPYSMNEKNELFVYSSSPPILIGSFNSDTQDVTLHTDWKEKSQSFLNAYRSNLKQMTESALEKAAALQGEGSS